PGPVDETALDRAPVDLERIHSAARGHPGAEAAERDPHPQLPRRPDIELALTVGVAEHAVGALTFKSSRVQAAFAQAGRPPRSTRSPSASISPVSSATDTNTDGESQPLDGCLQRSSASTPVIRRSVAA